MPSHTQSQGAQHAWAEIPRTDSPKRPVIERVADFLEIYTSLDEASAREQAMRCVQCPHPSCVEACPLGNSIPEWLALTAEGQFLEAAKMVEWTTCMGDVFSRLCNESCESQCVVDGPAASVAIHAVERFLLAYGPGHGVGDLGPVPGKGQTVAVVDAGPCGLACAHDLARRGYRARVFDQHPLPGGLLIHGAPAFRMDPKVVEHRLRSLQHCGVEFRLGPACGPLDLRALLAGHDAVFLGACAEEARPLRVPGAELRGVFQGVTFLLQNNGWTGMTLVPIDVRQKRVVVLGAGDTAMDCLRSAIRSGAREAVCVHRGDEQTISAVAASYIEAREEGAQFVFNAEVQTVEGGVDGSVAGVRCRVGTGLEQVMGADIVLVALGYEAGLPDGCTGMESLARGEGGRLRVDDRMMTSVPGVFAGGTLVTPSLRPVETVRDARRAAGEIDRFLAKGREVRVPTVGAAGGK